MIQYISMAFKLSQEKFCKSLRLTFLYSDSVLFEYLLLQSSEKLLEFRCSFSSSRYWRKILHLRENTLAEVSIAALMLNRWGPSTTILDFTPVSHMQLHYCTGAVQWSKNNGTNNSNSVLGIHAAVNLGIKITETVEIVSDNLICFYLVKWKQMLVLRRSNPSAAAGSILCIFIEATYVKTSMLSILNSVSNSGWSWDYDSRESNYLFFIVNFWPHWNIYFSVSCIFSPLLV